MAAERQANDFSFLESTVVVKAGLAVPKPFAHELLDHLHAHSRLVFDIIEGEAQQFPSIKQQMVLPDPLIGKLRARNVLQVRAVAIDFDGQPEMPADERKIDKSRPVPEIPDFILGDQIVKVGEGGPPNLPQK